MPVTTRFAPSPTGNLHIGGARTALFNWLYSRNRGGRFLLRIEDTDHTRSSEKFLESILESLAWLGLHHDEDIVFQSKRRERHVEIAKRLLSLKKAYNCYCTNKDIHYPNRKSPNEGCQCKYRKSKELKNDKNSVVKFEIPRDENISFVDSIYGKITIPTNQIDDIVILRSNNTPTYNLAVVVDDHDMQITDIIRGNDHISNTPKQILLYKALQWNIPNFSHIPLIHDSEGNKLSKRSHAVSIYDYHNLGILPEAMCNYLLRMGWSHGDDEVIDIHQAKEWFSIDNIGLSPTKLDDKKLKYLNNYYINKKEDIELLDMVLPIIEKKLKYKITKKSYLIKGLSELKKRSDTLIQLAESSLFYVQELPITLDQDASKKVVQNMNILKIIYDDLKSIEENSWNKNILSSRLKKIAETNNIKIQDIYPTIRAAITGRMNSPSIIEIMEVLGKLECLKRMNRL